ncbi:uncharacterized protein LOC117590849 [Drosophila guanche]|uniref:uncharacterized protein LOC117590849 n=1 Tax=Drosophila guanche TaxID=7266 RepID=UPI001471D168|nr:uncharacterized protein LOC117590849 [Drosophila guanche]
MVSTALTTLAAGQTTSSNNHHHHNHHHHQPQQPQQQQQQQLPYQRLPPHATASTGAAGSLAANVNQSRSFYALNGLEHDCDGNSSSSSNCPQQQQHQSSSPLNDQISLLFPKCRPKQQQQHHPQHQQQQQRHELHTDVNLNRSSSPIVSEAATADTDNVAAVIPTSTPSYYKSVNIITQSPPPHSASSHSSESLSSVTPRISTNPFLCAPLTPPTPPSPPLLHSLGEHPVEGEGNGSGLAAAGAGAEADEEVDETVLAAGYPASFYYHTGESRRGQSTYSVSEMPRKRNTGMTTSASASAISSSSSRQQSLHNGGSNVNGTASNGNTQSLVHSQNPFIKENYWEAAPMRASSLLISPTEYAEEQQQQQHQQQQHLQASARRAYHQQREQMATQLYGLAQRQATQQPPAHILRLGRSPINRSYTAPQQQQQAPHQQSVNKACADGLTPLASHYLYGSKSSLDQHGAGDWEPREQRKLRMREERERDRDPLLLEQEVQAARENHLTHLAGQQQQQQQRGRHGHGEDRERERELDHRLVNGSVTGNEVMYGSADPAESWQHLRVTTEENVSEESCKHPSKLVGKTLSTSSQSQSQSQVQLQLQSGLRSLEEAATYREHKLDAWQLERNYTLAVESRHGIIEYEGSPRRIGGWGAVTAAAAASAASESEQPPTATAAATAAATEATAPQQQQQQQQQQQAHTQLPMAAVPPLSSTATTLQKTAARAALVALAQTQNHIQNHTQAPQPPQQLQAYPVRPGFPQRILSPPHREPSSCSPQTPQHVAPQHHTSMMSNHSKLQQQPVGSDTNAEDTSNDVSEIGTMSDLTTPEAVALAMANEVASRPATATPPMQKAAAAVAAPPPLTACCSTVGAGTGVGLGVGVGPLSIHTKSSTFDYLYEFSETRKVLEEFFKCPSTEEQAIMENGSDADSIDIQYEFHSNFERDEEELADEDDEDEDGDDEENDEAEDEDEPIGEQDQEHDEEQETDQDRDYHQQQVPSSDLSRDAERHVYGGYSQPQQSQPMPVVVGRRPHYSSGSPLMRDFDFFLDSASRSSGERDGDQDGLNHNQLLSTGSGSGLGQSVGVGVGPASGHNFRYSPETTDYDSNCGDLDSLSGEMNGGGVSTSCSNYAKYYASAMPVLEDGLSSGHTSDTENNNNKNLQQTGVQGGPLGGQGQCPNSLSGSTSIGGSGGISMLMDMKRLSTNNSLNSMHNLTNALDSNGGGQGQGQGHLVNSPSPSNGHAKQPPSMPQPRELLGQSPSQTQSLSQSLGQSHSQNKVFKNIDPDLDSLYSISVFHRPDTVQMTPPPPAPAPHRKPNSSSAADVDLLQPSSKHTPLAASISSTLQLSSPTTTSGSGNGTIIGSVPGPTKTRSAGSNGNSNCNGNGSNSNGVLAGVPPPIPERSSLMAAQQQQQRSPSPVISSPVWLSRHLDGGVGKGLLESGSDNHSKNHSADEDDVDTDLETDRLLGHQRLDDQGYYDENKSWDRKPRSSLLSKISPKQQMPSTKTRNGYNALLSSTPELLPPPPIPPKNNSGSGGKLLDLVGGMVQRSISRSSSEHSEKSPSKLQPQQLSGQSTCGDPVDVVASAVVAATVAAAVATVPPMESPGNGGGSEHSINGGGGGIIKLEAEDCSLNGGITISGAAVTGVAGGGSVGSVNPGAVVSTAVNAGSNNSSGSGAGSNSGCGSGSGEKKVKKSGAVLIEGVLFRAKYLGSTQLVCEGQPTKSTRMMQAEEAVSRIKALAPDGDVQPSTEVDLFISTEKIMVLNTDLKEIMMDHALRTISYIADIGDLVVLMARRRFVPQDIDDAPKPNRTPKMICHVFESDEAQFIAQSIGQAFQVAYMEFLKANGIEDHRFVKEMDYQEVLNSQEIFGDELEIFAKKELQKEVVVPKAKGEILGVVIVESGWGSMLPTVVIANLMSSGAAARCGQLNIGDQLIAINGLSLVGLPLSTCQTYIKNTKNQTVVKFTVVPCAPVVEVKIKRPETKYQLGFSVQNK